jgi:hypothetical protein
MAVVGQGARVRYHGSYTELHGMDFVVTGNEPAAHYVEEYPDGVAYNLNELGGGLRGARLLNVRRSSFTVVNELDQ